MNNNKRAQFMTLVSSIAVCIVTLPLFTGTISAKVAWNILETITLDDTPIDVAVSHDESLAYILLTKSICVYSLQDKRATDTIPLKGTFSRIILSSDEEKLYLTDKKSKQVSIINITMIYSIETGNSPVIGKPEAPVSIVAFLDYQCPYCAKIYPVLEKLAEKYPNDVNLIIKHYPLRMHRFAQKAAQAALAASQQNKYKESTQILMANYKNLNDATIKKYIQETGIDMSTFDKAFNDPALQHIISQDMKLGAQLKVRGVPSLFINGRGVKNRSFDALSRMIESELKKK
ncbi:MAG: thioredoxin domain-containing protein [bacterium]